VVHARFSGAAAESPEASVFLRHGQQALVAAVMCIAVCSLVGSLAVRFTASLLLNSDARSAQHQQQPTAEQLVVTMPPPQPPPPPLQQRRQEEQQHGERGGVMGGRGRRRHEDAEHLEMHEMTQAAGGRG